MARAIGFLEKDLSYDKIDDKAIFSIISFLSAGIGFTVLAKLIKESPFTLDEWSHFLHLSERTMQRHQKERRAFDPIYAEKILSITLLYRYGNEVFGDADKFNSWLETKNVMLGNKVPKEFLTFSFGISLLKDELTRIEHGVLA